MKSIYLAVLALFLCLGLNAQGNLWSPIQEGDIKTDKKRYIKPAAYQTFSLDLGALEPLLEQAPQEEHHWDDTEILFDMPMPDGTLRTYRIFNSPIMERELAQKFPGINTYSGYDIDRPDENVRFDLTYQGFHAMFFTREFGTVYIDPYALNHKTDYIVYTRADFFATNTKVMDCRVETQDADPFIESSPHMRAPFGDCTYRTYRFAVAATGEYTTFHGGTVVAAQSAQVTTMNRVNMVYMRDIAVQFNIVGNNDLIIYTDSGADPYTNGNPSAMIGENQTNVDAVIGAANYDVGHVFGTNSGGLAGLGVICGGSKARGVTGSGAPIGDPFDIDYVAHEVGHQFGANHTFNNSCGGNRNDGTAYEPGSGNTIMAYAGICAPNTQVNSDDHFHFVSLEEMFNRMASTSCAATPAFSNSQPVISDITDGHTIPGDTPFFLDVTATDPESDDMSYCWEQYDREISTQEPVSTSTDGPNFRSNPALTSSRRYFPNLQDVVNNVSPTWEVLSSVSRIFNFRVTVRDNNASGGCNAQGAAVVTVDGNSGPFLVNYPTNAGINTDAASNETVTWDPAGTDNAPVNCPEVDILLSTDGGLTYPTTLLSGIPNDGSQLVLLPDVISTTARVMVVCSDNIFFDISNNNFNINSAGGDYLPSLAFIDLRTCDLSTESFTLDVESLGGYTDPVTMSASGLPAGMTATFSPNPVAPGGSTTVTFSGTGATGNYEVLLTGTSTSGTKSLPLPIEILGSAPPTTTLSSPGDGATGVNPGGTLTWASVSGADAYTIEIATDAGFSNIIETQTGITGTSYSPSSLSVLQTYYWRVRATNFCGESLNSVPFDFTTSGCSTIASTDVPVSISSSGTPTVTSTLDFTAAGTITEVSIPVLEGTHTWVSDLTFTLTSPAGTTITLFGGVCNNQDDFDIAFSDSGSGAAIACPPTGGITYQPTDPFSNFIGEDPNGTWTLTVSDAFDQDGGAINAWSLEVCYSPALPVELLAFDGDKVGRTNVLDWRTATEENSSHFIIERAGKDGIFEAIGRVEAAGFTISPRQYSFIDQEPYLKSYYRLKMVDLDETYEYSRTIVLERKAKIGTSIFPNPSSGLFNIEFQSEEDSEVSLELYDVLGRKVYSDNFSLDNGIQIREMDIKNLPAGVYLIQLQSNGLRIKTEQIIKQ